MHERIRTYVYRDNQSPGSINRRISTWPKNEIKRIPRDDVSLRVAPGRNDVWQRPPVDQGRQPVADGIFIVITLIKRDERKIKDVLSDYLFVPATKKEKNYRFPCRGSRVGDRWGNYCAPIGRKQIILKSVENG